MRLLLLTTLVAFGACAEAGKVGFEGLSDGSITLVDSDMNQPPPPDAFVSHIDAPPGMMTKTLDENLSDAIDLAHALACSSNLNNVPQYTLVNNYIRVFDPAQFGITTDFHVTQVSFQVNKATPNGGVKVTLKVGTYSGALTGTTLDTGSMATVATNAMVQVPQIAGGGTGGTVNQTIDATIPAGSKLFTEVDAPAMTNGQFFYFGQNIASDTVPSYISAPDCTVPNPTTMKSLNGNSQIAALMTVTGTY
jgi:hypothetical protein